MRRSKELADFYARVEKHDFHFRASDDSRRYDAGLAEEKALVALTLTDPRFMNIYLSRKGKMFARPKKLKSVAAIPKKLAK